ncbi:hypothetical protein DPMN_182945 [Dreissena polymorpha]|uniref:EF-hand domain-containing protein n=1 Tax=Dreissena polymorpha TaxID=45954 RepID=A0A9D4DFU6_DREPO|nr:hypothetical protein DPMN_182945 [Dreissena polymorpha]
MFKVFDRNGDKTISIEELRMGLKSMGTTFTYKEAMLAAKTIDKDSMNFTSSVLGKQGLL